ncbi:hypothetical protein ONR75_10415 [Rhodopseudomonas sp. P2A-2r]|uniref:hypothetical protein n=1 Tax=Rhodopseudomonas sp. P2A-2r TaxID=2991972 RepID=UPI0022344C27|nr:hypothetical protein [Rhodopseudomonas sp. P2A-2r]UZE50989.1 hypothetical protein ONR75_10415 [Rhodopseudomonas sp. P2A-2r]
MTLSNGSIFAALHERGHSPLPISRRLYPSDPKAFGKAPGIYGGVAPETGRLDGFF